MPADINFVPLVLEVAQGAFAQFAQIAKRGGVADQGMDFLFGGRAYLDGGQDEFEFLNEDAFDLQELSIIFLAEFLGAAQVDERAEVLLASQVVFHLVNELV